MWEILALYLKYFFSNFPFREVGENHKLVNQSRLGRRNPSADSLVAYICSFAYWIPFAYASSPLLKLSRHNPDDFFSFCTKLWYISEFLVENRPTH